jgi:hypothetical protein
MILDLLAEGVGQAREPAHLHRAISKCFISVQQLLKTIQDKPEIVSLIGRLVPHLSCRRAAKARALTAPRRLSGRCSAVAARPKLPARQNRGSDSGSRSIFSHPQQNGSPLVLDHQGL